MLLALRYAIIETTARNWDIKATIYSRIWYNIWAWETWGRIDVTTDSEIIILAINTHSLGLL